MTDYERGKLDGMLEAAQHFPVSWRQSNEFWIGCACGWNEEGKLRGIQQVDATTSQWSNHIRALAQPAAPEN